jgi:hypothetical protein
MAQLAQGLRAAADDPGLAAARSALLILGFVEPSPAAYEAVRMQDATLPALPLR